MSRGFARFGVLLGTAIVTMAAAPDGWQQYAAGQYMEAVATWTAAAAQGDPNAVFGLGLAYDLGRGVAQDEVRACGLYRRAGDAGVAAATFDYAVMLDAGRCGTRNAVMAADWYGRAAAAGHPRAQYDLAQLYERGDGVPRNLDQAAAWYRLAAESGLSAARVHAAALAAEPRAGPSDGTFQVAALLSPADVTLPDRGIAVPFVWSAPAQPGPIRFFLEVYSLRTGSAAEVAARFVDASAAEVILQPGAADYAWRVLTVVPDAQTYVTSPWQRFAVAAGGNP